MPEKLDKGEDEPRQEDPTEEGKPRPSHVPDRHYIKLDRRLLRYWLPAIGSDAVIIYEVIVDCFNEKLGYAYPSLPQIQKAARLSNRTVQTAISKLEEVGLIKVWRGGGKAKANRYVPSAPVVTEETVRLIKESAGEVIIDHLRLFSDTESIPVLDSTGIEKDDESIPVLDDTTTETEDKTKQGPNDPGIEKTANNKTYTGVKRHLPPVLGSTGTEIHIREEKRSVNNNNDHEVVYEGDTGKVVVVQEDFSISFPESEYYTPEEILSIRAIIKNIWELNQERGIEQSRNFIGKRVVSLVENTEYGLEYVAGKSAYMSKQSKKDRKLVENPLSFLTAACKENWVDESGSLSRG